MSNPHELFYPMLTLFLWHFLVVLRNLSVRTSAMKRGELTMEYFELFRGAEAPALVQQTSNHLRNLAEFPPLFYIVVLAIIVTGHADGLFHALAWAYVAARVAHSVVHLTINKVPPRFAFFLISNLVLLFMWVRLGLMI